MHLPNYWMLSRYDENANYFTIGQSMLPADISVDDNTFNQNLLLELLNKDTVFDKDLNLTDKDHLLLSFTVTEKTAPLEYGFEYANGKWQIAEDFYPYTWNNKHNAQQEGIIQNPFEA